MTVSSGDLLVIHVPGNYSDSQIDGVRAELLQKLPDVRVAIIRDAVNGRLLGVIIRGPSQVGAGDRCPACFRGDH